MSRSHKKIVRSWSTVEWLPEELDELAKQIKNASGVHCDRSKIINALTEVVIEHQDVLNMKEIVDSKTLKVELVSLMKKVAIGHL